MTFTFDAGALLGAALIVAGALVHLAREVSGLSSQVGGLVKSVDIEREDRVREDEKLEARIARLEEREA